MKAIGVRGRKRLDIRASARIEIADRSAVSVLIRPRGDARIEMAIGKGCVVDSCILHRPGTAITQSSRVGDGSVLRTCSLWLAGGKGEVTNILEGRRSEAYDVEIFIQGDESRLTLNTILHHCGEGTKGDITVRGVVKDRASATLGGMIKIEKSGKGAESFLSQHAMLLNPGAHASARPELEIENNDVSSRHAASVSQLDEDKIFYLMSRGLGRNDARKMIEGGFLAAAVERIWGESFRERIAGEIRRAL